MFIFVFVTYWYVTYLCVSFLSAIETIMLSRTGDGLWLPQHSGKGGDDAHLRRGKHASIQTRMLGSSDEKSSRFKSKGGQADLP